MPNIIPFEQSEYRAMCSVKRSCEVIRNPTAITATATYLLSVYHHHHHHYCRRLSMSTNPRGNTSTSEGKTRPPRRVPCEIWIAGFRLTLVHLYLICAAHGLTMEEIERQEPLPAARRIMENWRGGVDLIELHNFNKDGSPRLDFLLILRVAPQLRGQEVPVDMLRYEPSFADILPTIFAPSYVKNNEEYFPGGKLPWVGMPWPRYLYGAYSSSFLVCITIDTITVTPCVRRALDRYADRCRNIARAHRKALENATEQTSSAVSAEGATPGDDTFEKQGHERPTREPNSEQELEGRGA